MTYESYKATWSQRTTKQVERELKSWNSYMNKHSQAYAWHGKDMTPPGGLADGDKVSALKEILDERASQPIKEL